MGVLCLGRVGADLVNRSARGSGRFATLETVGAAAGDGVRDNEACHWGGGRGEMLRESRASTGWGGGRGGPACSCGSSPARG